MKARIPLTSKQEKEVQRRVAFIVQKELSKSTQSLVRRVIKLFLAALHEDFGFGEQRLRLVMAKVQGLLDEIPEDEIFWEHLDRVLIDRMHLGLERDYTEKGRPVSDEDYDRSAGSDKAV